MTESKGRKMNVPWMDRTAQYLEFRSEFDAAIGRVLESGDYELGEDVFAFEKEFAEYCGRSYAVSVGSGSDAIDLSLRAWGIGPGDEVISVANSCCSVPLAVLRSRANLVLVDIDEETYNLDPAKVEEAITPSTRVILAQHGQGIPCEIDTIIDIAERHKLRVIEDGTVALGARYKGRPIGIWGDVAIYSFAAGKMLGSFTNGAGIVVTDSQELADKVRISAHYGQRDQHPGDAVPRQFSQTRIVCSELGYNSHIGSLQAAILRVKLRHFKQWIERRKAKATLYENLLKGLPIVLPPGLNPPDMEPVYRGYLVQVEHRDQVLKRLNEEGIEARLLYLPPVHLQPAFRNLGYRLGDFPVTERVSQRMISLPIYPEMSNEQIRTVVDVLKEAISD